MQPAQILVALVLYRCKLADAASWQSLGGLESPAHFFIWDNSPEGQEMPDTPRIDYVHCPENLGVSAAYNAASRQARALGIPWLLLADQDTSFPEGALSNVPIHERYAIMAWPACDALGQISPFLFRWGRGWRVRDLPPGRCSLRKYRLINSGLLVTTKLFEEAGGYNEQLPLDFSDIEFLERAGKQASHFLLLSPATQHRLSGSAHQPPEQALIRFRHYATGALRFGTLTARKCQMASNVLIRAIVQSLRYGNVKFLRIALAAYTE